MLKEITTPRGRIFQTKEGKAMLEWNPGFAPRRNQAFANAQKFVDNEVLRRCSPRVPFRTGMLEKSGILGTTIGSGEVQYIVPYAAYQYYATRQSRTYDANRGAKWFERMKTEERDDILKGAKKLV